MLEAGSCWGMILFWKGVRSSVVCAWRLEVGFMLGDTVELNGGVVCELI